MVCYGFSDYFWPFGALLKHLLGNMLMVFSRVLEGKSKNKGIILERL